MHNAIATIQIVRFNFTNILYQFSIRCDERLPIAAFEKTNIATNNCVTLLFKDVNQMGPDIAAMTCSKNSHNCITIF